MNHSFSFGKHEGKTFESVFFRDPAYADWIYRNGIHRQPHAMDEQEGDYFYELHRRANHLKGTCSVCGERPLSRMGLTTLRGTGQLAQVGFYCNECDYRGGTPTAYYRPSFFVNSHYLNNRDGKMITSEIKRHLIGTGNLTQAKMEQFFRNDVNFAQAEAGFFTRIETEVQKS